MKAFSFVWTLFDKVIIWREYPIKLILFLVPFTGILRTISVWMTGDNSPELLGFSWIQLPYLPGKPWGFFFPWLCFFVLFHLVMLLTLMMIPKGGIKEHPENVKSVSTICAFWFFFIITNGLYWLAW